MRLGYARVSTEEQCLDHQLDALRAAGCTAIYQEKISGKVRRGPELKHVLSKLKPGDSIVVWRCCRLGRTFRHRVDLGDELHERGITIVSLTEGLDTSTSFGMAIYRVLSIFADMEHEGIVTRTKAGLAAAKARGVRLGKRPKLTAAQVITARELAASGQGAQSIAIRLGVGRSTLYRYVCRADDHLSSNQQPTASNLLSAEPAGDRRHHSADLTAPKSADPTRP